MNDNVVFFYIYFDSGYEPKHCLSTNNAAHGADCKKNERDCSTIDTNA